MAAPDATTAAAVPDDRLRARLIAKTVFGVSDLRRANDGHMYTSEEFIEYYGPARGVIMWNKASERCNPADLLCRPSCNTVTAHTGERRRDLDGSAQVCTEFLKRHGDLIGALLWQRSPVVQLSSSVSLSFGNGVLSSKGNVEIYRLHC